MTGRRRTNKPKWKHADYVRFARHYDQTGHGLKRCAREMGCGQAAMQIAVGVFSRRRKARLYYADDVIHPIQRD